MNSTPEPQSPAAEAAAQAPAGAPNAAAPGASAPQESALPTTETLLAELQVKHTEMSDAYLRAKAETENVRRRSEEEVAKARKFAVESFAENLLPVKDSLEAAIAIQKATPEQLLEGVHATLRQLTQALERSRVLQISPPAGTKFDPHQHQAISVVPADQEPNTVVSVLQKGYVIADRVLRPALVTVTAPK
jgi:molecular chaperone GrpE